MFVYVKYNSYIILIVSAHYGMDKLCLFMLSIIVLMF